MLRSIVTSEHIYSHRQIKFKYYYIRFGIFGVWKGKKSGRKEIRIGYRRTQRKHSVSQELR